MNRDCPHTMKSKILSVSVKVVAAIISVGIVRPSLALSPRIVRGKLPFSSLHRLPSFYPRRRPTFPSALASFSSSPDDPLPNLTHDEIARYSRHLVLSTVGVRGQRLLKKSAVLCIGAGGLGSPLLLYLAAAGVGTIGIVDADVVDTSNLQRQIVHGTSTVGVSKCESARRRIADVNPHVKVVTYEEELTSHSALRLLRGDGNDFEWDVVVDGSDNFPTKYLINDACDMVGIPWVYAAILGFEGQISTFNYRGMTGSEVAAVLRRDDGEETLPEAGPDYRDLLPVPPPPGDVPSCAEGGVLGILPGTFGCMQATEVIKILLKLGDTLSGRVVVWDALSMRFSEIKLAKDPNSAKVTELIDYQGFCAGHLANGLTKVDEIKKNGGGRTMDETEGIDSKITESLPSYQSLSPTECLSKLTSGWTPHVLDVRLQTEHDIVSLPFTDEVAPHRTVQLSNVPNDGRDVLIYCKAGIRGKKAAARLVELGVDPFRLYNLDGGIMGWIKDVDSSMPKY
mmetsp:Transcript_38066/g.88560  ORF Transcript_38066/g.88560 Transcript_38066/m.88560 type:complete len:511 (-) Transcript_38066:1685-3217(-)